MLLDHEQLLLPEHLLLGEELELGCVLQRAACTVYPRPHRGSTLQYVTSCRAMEDDMRKTKKPSVYVTFFGVKVVVSKGKEISTCLTALLLLHFSK